MSLFRVAIHYGINSNGFLSYDTEAKTVSVDLPEQEWVDKVIALLKTMNMPSSMLQVLIHMND